MHGYDVGVDGGGGGGGGGGMPPMPPQGQGPPLVSNMDVSGHHPDSTDSYVTYLESDDSIQGSP